MKFKDKYKRDIDQLTVSPAVTDAILNSQTKKHIKRGALRVIALAACICIVFSSVLTMSLIALFNGGIISNSHLTGTDPSLKTNNNATVPLVGVKSYDDIFSTLSKRFSENSLNSGRFSETIGADLKSSTDGAPQAPQENDSAKKPDYSDTNNQVEGVQEADIIKTDGRFIYTTSVPQYYYYYYYDENKKEEPNKNFVYIVSADDGKMAPVSKIEIRTSKEKPYQIAEIMLYEDTLVIIKQSNLYKRVDKVIPDMANSLLFGRFINYNYGYGYNESFTAAEIYDITDRSAPKFKGELYQSGSYQNSRMIGKNLYLISNYYINSNANINDAESYIPIVSTHNKKDLMAASSIYFADDESIAQYGASYYVLTGIDVTQPDEHKSSKSVLCGNIQSLYSNDSSIYLAAVQNNYPNYNKIAEYNVGEKIKLTYKTNIYRLAINNGELSFAASGTVDGTPINQFAMDEYKDVFRIATTINSQSYTVQESLINKNGEKYKYFAWVESDESFSNVYTLDLSLKQKGVLTGLGKTERIYSVRYDGDIGYIVTFRQTDPLYAIDLSDAKNPKVLSELKIPGFSNYMHPYGDGLLFGFGMDADDDGRVQGMKLSMFDVSNKKDVKEISIEKLKNTTYSNAQYNHKAILVNAKKNLIGFPVFDYSNWNKDHNDICKYYLYSYENGKFVQKAILKPDFGVNDAKYYNEMRGIYIGDYAYMIIQDVGIISYDMNKFEKVDTIKFDF